MRRLGGLGVLGRASRSRGILGRHDLSPRAARRAADEAARGLYDVAPPRVDRDGGEEDPAQLLPPSTLTRREEDPAQLLSL